MGHVAGFQHSSEHRRAQQHSVLPVTSPGTTALINRDPHLLPGHTQRGSSRGGRAVPPGHLEISHCTQRCHRCLLPSTPGHSDLLCSEPLNHTHCKPPPTSLKSQCTHHQPCYSEGFSLASDLPVHPTLSFCPGILQGAGALPALPRQGRDRSRSGSESAVLF